MANSKTSARNARNGSTSKRAAMQNKIKSTSVTAAQRVLRTIERREATLRKAVKRHKKSLKQLKTDLDNVSETRKSVSR